MINNFGKNLNKTEEIKNLSEFESTPDTLNIDKIDNSCIEAGLEINQFADSIINEGAELSAHFPEIKDCFETESLEEINQEIVNLKQEANDSIAWVKERFNLSKMEKEIFLDIEIQGSEEFREKIKNSLKFLSLAPEKLDFSQKYIKRIQEWEHSGMNMFKDKPTFEIGELWKNGDEVYLASGIAHDAYHSFLCENSQDAEGNISAKAFTGKEAEKKCLAFQIDALDKIKKSDYMKDNQEIVQEHIDGLKEHLIDPTYQDIPYEERNW